MTVWETRDLPVLRALTTSDETYRAVFGFAESLGKEPITAPDRPGFIVNRLLVPYLLDAIRAYENGLGTLEDIDKGMKLGCGYPMGPFTLLDFVGLDTTYYIANIMFEEFREPAYAPPPLLKRMVLAGLGVASRLLGRVAGGAQRCVQLRPLAQAVTGPAAHQSLQDAAIDVLQSDAAPAEIGQRRVGAVLVALRDDQLDRLLARVLDGGESSFHVLNRELFLVHRKND